MNITDGDREPQKAVWEVGNGAKDPQVEWQKQDVTGGRRTSGGLVGDRQR